MNRWHLTSDGWCVGRLMRKTIPHLYSLLINTPSPPGSGIDPEHRRNISGQIYCHLQKTKKNHSFWRIFGYAALLESLVLQSPSSCDPQKTKKNQWFLKHFAICRPLGISCPRVALIMWPSENLEKPFVFEAFWDMQPSWNLSFSYGVQSSYKIASRSPQDRSRTPQNAPRPPTWG